MTTKRKLIRPTPEEDAAIAAGIALDPDARELSDAEFYKLKPMRPRGRPVGSGSKEQLTLRLDTAVVEAFKRSGAGWQTKINDALKDWLETHQVR